MLSIDLSVVIIFVIVWILVLVLTRVYFKPVRRIMTERDTIVKKDLDDAREKLENYDSAIEKIETEMKAAKTAAREIRENFGLEAQKAKEAMIHEVTKECRAQVDKARRELDEKVECLKKELEPQGKNLAERIEKRLLN